MFKELGQFAGLMKNLPKIREEMGKLQERLGQITAEGDAGAGMVKASQANGHMEVQHVASFSDDVVKMNDKEMLEDLIASAVNQAPRKSASNSWPRKRARWPRAWACRRA